MKYKNIIFDIGGVLAGPTTGHWFITPNFWKIVDKDLVNEEKLKKSLDEFMYLHTQEPKTEAQEQEMFSDYYYRVLKDINYPNLSKEVADKLADDCVYNDDKIFFYEDDKIVLETLSKEYDLYIISDSWASITRILKKSGIVSYFKGITISYVHSSSKEEKLFNIFLEENKNVNPRESLYIDDRSFILDKANECGFNLLLMDRDHKDIKCKYKIINNMNDILENLN